jgi:hypothetical protein
VADNHQTTAALPNNNSIMMLGSFASRLYRIHQNCHAIAATVTAATKYCLAATAAVTTTVALGSYASIQTIQEYHSF